MKRTVTRVIYDAFSLMKRDIKEMKWAITMIIAYFVLGKLVFHSTCPVVMAIGFPCLACGLTRAGMSLLGMDFIKAWQFHPFIYVIAIYAIIYIFRRYILLKDGQKGMIAIGIVIIVTMTLFFLWRMITVFPGEPPMSYYANNLLHRIIQYGDL